MFSPWTPAADRSQWTLVAESIRNVGGGGRADAARCQGLGGWRRLGGGGAIVRRSASHNSLVLPVSGLFRIDPASRVARSDSRIEYWRLLLDYFLRYLPRRAADAQAVARLGGTSPGRRPPTTPDERGRNYARNAVMEGP